MHKNCVVNEHALELLDPIRDRLGCSYSRAILELSRQNKSDVDRINETFRVFHDDIFKIVDGATVDKLFLDIMRIVVINRSTGKYTEADLDNINKVLETLFDRTKNEVK